MKTKKIRFIRLRNNAFYMQLKNKFGVWRYVYSYREGYAFIKTFKTRRKGIEFLEKYYKNQGKVYQFLIYPMLIFN